MMEKGGRGLSCRAAVCGIVVLLCATAFSCSLAAEFRRVKDGDMKLDGSLCSLPRSSAFELGVAAIAFLSVAQLVGTTAAATTMCASSSKPGKPVATGGRVAPVALLALSWVCFALAVILLATAASMNSGQRYGRGWMDGDCYVARNGVFGGAAALVVVTALLILGLTFVTKTAAAGSSTTACARRDAACTTTIRVDAATGASPGQPGGRSKQ
ncbi:hypothetical protein CFC21_093251 [Triticum aestivum]|uniref:CASP-like protein n=2 Tax=Triticum aestivum TaxID=4565 RepID=A0A9R1MV27_WHEAT|nr:protein MODIFYING WALL LIGNIN-1-like [Triticum aestivum]KAF7090505.1 hypothetical protein CFC21_093250 [Triticum aestivum]KAF7090506.1 hypothetical protein CFC21_093251 [Triticum aestivum]